MSYIDRLTTASLRTYYDHVSTATSQPSTPIEPYLRRTAHLAWRHGWAWGFAIGVVLDILGLALYWYMR